jgi:hypothetical protein
MDHSVGQLHLEDNIYALESLLWYIMPASTCNEHAHNVAAAIAVVVVHGTARHLGAASRYQNRIELEAKTPAWSDNSLVCSTWTLFFWPLFLFMLEIFVETYIESCYCELLVSQNMNPSLAGLNDALDLADMDKKGQCCCYSRFFHHSSYPLILQFVKCVMVH